LPISKRAGAQRIGLKPNMIGHIYVIGPERIGFRTDNLPYRAKDMLFKRRAAFSNRQLVDNADGIAGPETFPFTRSTFLLRACQPGDRTIRCPDQPAGHRS
jgi:hypothetical protein